MRGEETTRDHFKENLGGAIRVLPGIGLVQGHLLQAFSRRGVNKTKRSAHLAESTAGFTEEKTLAVVQHESLLMFRGRPFEVPHGCTTKLAKRKAKQELNEAVLEMIVRIKHKRYLEQARLRREACKEMNIKDDSYSNAQLKEAARTWRKATRHRLKISRRKH